MPSDQKFQADRDQIALFVRTIFKHATSGKISLRAFTHDKPSEKWGRVLARGDDWKDHWQWPWCSVSDRDPKDRSSVDDLTKVIDAAARMAERCANAGVPAGVVFAPPCATLNSPWSAKTADIAEGPVLSAEIDGPDELHPKALAPHMGRAILLDMMGPPTLSMASGSIWVDPKSGEEEPTLHFPYRLRVPTRSPDEHEKLREARNLLARLIGSDCSAAPLVHPLRMAGSWNTKRREPRMALIIEVNDEIEIDLDATLAKLRAITVLLNPEDRADRPTRVPRHYEEADDTEAKVIAALAVIPNNYDRSDWLLVGMEIHDGLGDAGFALFDD
jgi:hypothetical protein